MFLTILDLVLILIIFVFVAYGFVAGLIQAIGALVGLFIGAYLAGQFYEPFAEMILPIVLGNENFANIAAFVLIFGITSRLIGFAFHMINKVFHIFSIIPFLKSINRLAGAFLGLLEGVLVLSLILYFVSRFPLTAWLSAYIVTSNVAAMLIFAAEIFSPFLPEISKEIKSLI